MKRIVTRPRVLLLGVAVTSLLAAAQPAMAAGTKVVVAPSEFGSMLWTDGGRALYVFERDPRDRSRCHRACARLWPPLLTKGEPVAGPGVRRGLLGTIRRRNGRRQVTYRGRPLYTYAHEGRGEVECHDVDLNGGRWWVVGPDGRRRR